VSGNYASILARLFLTRDSSGMHSDLELAYAVTEVLVDTLELPDPWLRLRKEARGFIKTRAKRSRNKFKMQFKVALEQSDLPPTGQVAADPGQELSSDREQRFKDRVLNPGYLRIRPSVYLAVSVEPVNEVAIITEEQPLCTKERENDFTRRITNPRSLRRGDKTSV
jgi:hypothetical protein